MPRLLDYYSPQYWRPPRPEEEEQRQPEDLMTYYGRMAEQVPEADQIVFTEGVRAHHNKPFPVAPATYDEIMTAGHESLKAKEPGHIKVLTKALARGVQGSLAGSVNDLIGWGADILGAEETGESFRQAGQWWRKQAQTGWEAPDPYLHRGTFGENPSFKRALSITGEAIPSLALGLTMGGAGTAAGLSRLGAALLSGYGLGALEGAGVYQEAREADKGVAEATFYGGVATAAIGLLEAGPIGRILGRTKGGLFRGLYKGALEEGGTEALQQFAQNLIAKIGYEPTRELTQGVLESIIGGMGAGGIAGGTMAPINKRAEQKQNEFIAKQFNLPVEEVATLRELLQEEADRNRGLIDRIMFDEGEVREKEFQQAAYQKRLDFLQVMPAADLKTAFQQGQVGIQDLKALSARAKSSSDVNRAFEIASIINDTIIDGMDSGDPERIARAKQVRDEFYAAGMAESAMIRHAARKSRQPAEAVAETVAPTEEISEAEDQITREEAGIGVTPNDFIYQKTQQEGEEYLRQLDKESQEARERWTRSGAELINTGFDLMPEESHPENVPFVGRWVPGMEADQARQQEEAAYRQAYDEEQLYRQQVLRDRMEILLDALQSGEPGRRVLLEGDEWRGLKSGYDKMFREFMAKHQIDKKGIVNIIEKGLRGKNLTNRQQRVYDSFVELALERHDGLLDDPNLEQEWNPYDPVRIDYQESDQNFGRPDLFAAEEYQQIETLEEEFKKEAEEEIPFGQELEEPVAGEAAPIEAPPTIEAAVTPTKTRERKEETKEIASKTSALLTAIETGDLMSLPAGFDFFSALSQIAKKHKVSEKKTIKIIRKIEKQNWDLSQASSKEVRIFDDFYKLIKGWLSSSAEKAKSGVKKESKGGKNVTTDVSKPERSKASVSRRKIIKEVLGGAAQEVVDPQGVYYDAVRQLLKVFGRKAAFYKQVDKTEELPSGFITPESPDFVFLNVGTFPDYFSFVAGHELAHVLENEHPDLYKQLIDFIKFYPDAQKEFKEQLLLAKERTGIQNRYKKIGKALDKEVNSELVANYLGDRFLHKDFWDDVYKHDPTLAERLLDVVRRLLNKMRGALDRPFQSEIYIENIEQADKVLAKVTAEFAKQQAAAEGSVESSANVRIAKPNSDVNKDAVQFSIMSFNDGIEVDIPEITDSLLQNKPISSKAMLAWRRSAKKAGLASKNIEAAIKQFKSFNKIRKAGNYTVLPQIEGQIVIREGALNTPAVQGYRRKRLDKYYEGMRQFKKTVEIGSFPAGTSERKGIKKDWQGKQPLVFLNVPITQPDLQKPTPPFFSYPLVVTGNPHITNFRRPRKSWDKFIKVVRVKPVYKGNKQALDAVTKAINYANEIDAKILVTNFRAKNLWVLAKFTDIVPTDPKHPDFKKYWQENPNQPSQNKRKHIDYVPYVPLSDVVAKAFRAAGWGTAKEIFGEGSMWWWPKSKELDPYILKRINKDTKLEYCDLLHQGCPACRNCQKLTYPEAAGAPIISVTDEPFCEHGCPQCFVRLGQSGVSGRKSISIGLNLKQAGYGEPDVGDIYPQTINALQKAAKDPQQKGRVNYASHFLSASPKDKMDMVTSLYLDGRISVQDLQNAQHELGLAFGEIFNHVAPEVEPEALTDRQGQPMFSTAPVPTSKEFKDWQTRFNSTKPLIAYHGSPYSIESFKPNTKNYSPALMLGFHFGKDPRVANTFATGDGKVYPVYLSMNAKTINQPKDKTGKLLWDDTAVAIDVIDTALPKHEEIFVKFFMERYEFEKVTKDQAREVFQALKQGKEIDINTGRRILAFTKDKLTNAGTELSLGSMWDEIIFALIDQEDRQTLINTYKKELKKQGYNALQYINTSTDEVEPGTDPTSYIVFEPEQVKSIWNKGTWNPEDPRISFSTIPVPQVADQFLSWWPDESEFGYIVRGEDNIAKADVKDYAEDFLNIKDQAFIDQVNQEIQGRVKQVRQAWKQLNKNIKDFSKLRAGGGRDDELVARALRKLFDEEPDIIFSKDPFTDVHSGLKAYFDPQDRDHENYWEEFLDDLDVPYNRHKLVKARLLPKMRRIVEEKIKFAKDGWKDIQRQFVSDYGTEAYKERVAEGAKFSVTPLPNRKDLMATHGLTVQNLIDADRLGGFPMPSIGIVRQESGSHWIDKSGIGLIFGRKTIDPSVNPENRVFSQDIYSPTFEPLPVFIATNYSQARKFFDENKEAFNFFKEDRNSFTDSIYSQIFQLLRRPSTLFTPDSPSLQYVFLRDELHHPDKKYQVLYKGMTYQKYLEKLVREKPKSEVSNFLRGIIRSKNALSQYAEWAKIQKALVLQNDTSVLVEKHVEEMKKKPFIGLRTKTPRTVRQAKTGMAHEFKTIQEMHKWKDIIRPGWIAQEEGEHISLEVENVAEKLTRYAQPILPDFLEKPVWRTMGPYNSDKNQKLTHHIKLPDTEALDIIDEHLLPEISEYPQQHKAILRYMPAGIYIDGFKEESYQSVEKAKKAAVKILKDHPEVVVRIDREAQMMTLLRMFTAYHPVLNKNDKKLTQILNKVGFVDLPKDLFVQIKNIYQKLRKHPTSLFEAKPTRAIYWDEVKGAVVKRQYEEQVKPIFERRGVPYIVVRPLEDIADALEELTKKISPESEVMFSTAKLPTMKRMKQESINVLSAVGDKVKGLHRWGPLGSLYLTQEYDPTGEGKKISYAANQLREALTHKHFQVLAKDRDAQGQITGENVPETLQQLRNEGVPLGRRLKGFDLFGWDDDKLPQRYRQVKDALIKMDIEEVKWWDTDQGTGYRTKLIDQGTTPEVIEAIDQFRRGMDRALSYMAAKLKEVMDAMEKAGRKPEDVIIDEIELPNGKKKKISLLEAYQEMGRLYGFYFPRIRESGPYHVVAFKGDDAYRYGARNALAARRLATKLENKGFVVKRDKNGRPYEDVEAFPEYLYQPLDIQAVQEAIEASLKGVKGGDPDVQRQFHEDLIKSTADLLKARAMRAHRIGRKTGPVVKGYIEDPLAAYLLYSRRIAGGLAKGEAAQRMAEALTGKYVPFKHDGDEWVYFDDFWQEEHHRSVADDEGKDEVKQFFIPGVDPQKEPDRYKTYQKYIEAQLRNPDAWDQAINTAKAVVSLKYLGFNPRSAVVNTTALLQTAPPAIHQYVLDGKGSFMKIGAALAKASKDYVQVMRGKALPDADEQAFMDKIKEEAIDAPKFTREAMKAINTGYGKAWEKVMSGGMWLFSKTEQWNRGTTMLAAYRLARQVGKEHEASMKAAENASNRAHGIYGMGTLPPLALGDNLAGKLLRMGFTFQKFANNYLQMMGDMLKKEGTHGLNKRNYKAFVYALVAPGIIGGTAAAGAYSVAMTVSRVIMKAFGDDREPDKLVAELIRENLGVKAEETWRYGLAGLAGVDISSSLSVGMEIPRDLLGLTGAYGGVIKDVYQAGDYLLTGQTDRAIEKVLPTGFANLPRAYREHLEGATTSKGFRVWDEEGRPYRPRTTETAARVLGFQSARRATQGARVWASKKERKRYDDRRRRIRERYRAWALDPKRDPGELQNILDAIAEYNNQVLGQGRAALVPLITQKSLLSQERRLLKPTKRQMALIQ